MTANGIAQIVLYVVILTALAYPLGIYMARVYEGTFGFVNGRLAKGERLFLRLVGSSPDHEQNWKSYAGSVVVFSIVFTVLLYLLLRWQAHLPLNPDDLPDVTAPIAFNTTTSFLTNTNWQYYGGEYTMSYLTQMAGLAVQNFVSAAVGMAVLAAVIRGFSPQTSDLGNFWVDLYRSLAYILLPMSVVLAAILVSQGVPQTLLRPRRRAHAAGRHADDRPRPGRVADRDQASGHERRRLLQRQLGGAVREPQRVHRLLELFPSLLIPIASIFMFGSMIGRMRHAWTIFAARCSC